MFARVKLVLTATERAEQYFKGISQGGSLYNADVGDIPVPVSDPERYTTAGTNDTEGPFFKPSDTEGSDSNGRNIHPVRTRRVQFTLPREPRTGDDLRGGVGGQAEDRRYTELMDTLPELQEEAIHGDRVPPYIAPLEAIRGDRVPPYSAPIKWITLSYTGFPYPLNVRIEFAGQAPHALIDPDHLAAYQAYKRNSTEELRDVDLLEPVGVPWFHRF
ncbi:hypothetical protein LWI28_010045 [Acer negundo]|uniref:Uncharacterized protein n=1 Tax=Acer negundo TaxID=4023 RepID=A0AAD5P2P2_ACENE|nr:hypothetical protein LWI28_010045 [Acer negundo]